MNNNIIYICAFITLTILIMLLVIGLFTGFLKFQHDINISAILTFFSILVATAAFAVTLSNYSSNQKQYYDQQRQKKESDERSQALNISGWFDDYTDPTADRSFPRARVTIVNSSNIPVYQMFIFMVPNKVEAKFENLKDFGNGSVHMLKYLELVKPGATNTEVNAGGNFAGGGHDSVAILFKDTSSVYWYRSNYGTLEKLDSKQVQQKLMKNNITGPYQQYAE